MKVKTNTLNNEAMHEFYFFWPLYSGFWEKQGMSRQAIYIAFKKN